MHPTLVRSAGSLVLGVACGLSSGSAHATGTDTPSIAVLELKPTSADDTKVAQLVTDALAVGVGKAHRGVVVSQREVASRMDVAAQQQLLGCESDTCVVELSRALAVDQVIAGRVGQLNGQVLVFLSLISMKDGGVLARTSLSLPAQDPHLTATVEREASKTLQAAPGMQGANAAPPTVVALQRAAESLLADDAEKTADQKLTDLRIAVMFDEVKTDGGDMTGRPVERCVENEFRDAGADIVSGAAVATLKGKSGPRVLLHGGIPDSMTADEVDVVVVGAVEYETTRNDALGVETTGAALTLSLLKVDTGEVIATATPRGKGTGHGAQAAQRASAENVCALVRPALQQALATRVRRGERLVLEVRGVQSPAAAQAIVDVVAKQKSVGRARLKRLSGDKAIIDVVVKGGDGVALALELSAARAGPRIVEAGPAALKMVVDAPTSEKGPALKATRTKSG
jgi:TolB-like protein